METVVETITNRPLTERPAWKDLEEHFKKVRNLHLRPTQRYELVVNVC